MVKKQGQWQEVKWQMAKRSSRGSDACCLVPPGIHWAIQLHHLLLPSMQCSDTPSPYPCLYFLLHVLDQPCPVLGPGPSKDHSVLLDGLSSKVCFSIATAKLKHTLCNHQDIRSLVVCLVEQNTGETWTTHSDLPLKAVLLAPAGGAKSSLQVAPCEGGAQARCHQQLALIAFTQQSFDIILNPSLRLSNVHIQTQLLTNISAMQKISHKQQSAASGRSTQQQQQSPTATKPVTNAPNLIRK